MERFDAIVVGAGPAGSAAAYSLAKAHKSVLLVERGRIPGVKNVFGGRIYSYPLNSLLPDWRKDCPVERFVSQENLVLMNESSSLSIQLDSPILEGDASASFTALRYKFDDWLAKKAEAAGAMLITGIRVDEVWRENGRVRGVIASGGDRVAADVVIAADGAVSRLARKAGLLGEALPGQYAVGVKETVQLDKETIESRFNLGENDGAAYVYAGYASQWLRGGGFLYTNKDTVSLGLVVSSEDLSLNHIEIHDVMEKFKLHPSMVRLIKGGKAIEYSAHLVPELGIRMKPRLVADGMLVAGDAAGFLINNGYTFRGVDLAIASGDAAAEAAKRSLDSGDCSASSLSVYEQLLKDRKVLADLETFSRTPLYLKNRRLFDLYPRLVTEMAKRVYAVDGEGKETLFRTALNTVRGRTSPITLLKDLIDGMRSM